MYRSLRQAWPAASWQAVAPAQSPDFGRKAGLGHPVLLLKASARTPNPKGEGGQSSSGISLSVLAAVPGHTLLGALYRTDLIQMPPGGVTSPVIPPEREKGLLGAINAGAMSHPATLARKEPPRTSVIQHCPELWLYGPAAGGPLPAPAGHHPSSEEGPLQAPSYSSFS